MAVHLFLSRPLAVNHRLHGFTLIEILVVVVILGILALAFTIAVGSAGGARRLQHEAERLLALMTYACEQAELTGREVGVAFSNAGYQFSLLDHDRWVPFKTDALRERSWQRDTHVVLSRDSGPIRIAKTFPEKPQLVCFSSGELTPFQLELMLAENEARYRIRGEADATIELQTVAEPRR